MAKTNLGIFLRKLRIANNYTQEYVAKHLEVTRQAYGHYENGVTTPDIYTLTKLANLFQVPITTLIPSTQYSEPTLFKEDAHYFTEQQLHHHVSDFLSFYSKPENLKKYHYLDRTEKEMLYYFQKLSPDDQNDLLLFALIKAAKHF